MRSQQIEERSVRAGSIPRKAVSLEESEALCNSIRFSLSDQARFTNPCLPTNQGHLPLTSFRLVNECMNGCQVGCATNQDRAPDWGTEECLHSVCYLLTNVFTPNYYPFMYLSFSLTCSRLTWVYLAVVCIAGVPFFVTSPS